MSFTVIIPSRYGSTRLPAKALADIHGRPLIQHVAKRALESEAERVIVATDDQRIAEVLESMSVEVCMTSPEHESGSDRLAEVVQSLKFSDDHIVVNVQGDEPSIPPRLINEVAATLATSGVAVMSTAAQEIKTEEDKVDPNLVKVVFNQFGSALYFSRSTVPFERTSDQATHWQHVGIYAYRSAFLKRYSELKPSALEKAENLEQLRVLDNGEQILVHTIDYAAGVGVDTELDLQRARHELQNSKW